MKFKFLVGLLLIALCAALPLQTLAQTSSLPSSFPPTYSSLPWITVSGTHFAYDNGTYVLLHGADYSGAEVDSFTFTPEDFQAMASWGFNVIRMPIAWSFVEPKPGVYDQQYINQVKQAVAMANRYGIYVIIDMHQWHWSPYFGQLYGTTTNGLPTWTLPYQQQTKDAEEKDKAYFWSNLTVEQDFANMWEYVASQFANDSGVLGYDLFNEPTTPTNWTSQQMYKNMARVYDMTISAIRKVDQRHIIFFETTDWDQGTDFGIWVEPVDPAHKLAIEVHDYWTNPLSPPLYAALQASQQWDMPVYDGEFGAGMNSPLLATEAFNEYGIAWTYWSYSWGAGGADSINYQSNPFLGILDEAYPRLSSVPVSSLTVTNVTSNGFVSEVIVNATFAGKSGWADFFIPEGFNVTSPSGAFSASSRTFNVTFDDGSVSLRLSPPPGYGFAGALFTIATLPSEPVAGVPFNVSAWVSYSNGSAIGNSAVLLLINGKQVASSTTNSQGMAQFTATVAQPGNCSLAVELKQYPFVYGNRTIQVLPPPSISLEAPSTVPVGHQASLTASVSSQGSPISGVSVSFYANGTQIGSAVTNSSGLASLAYVPRSVGTTSLTASLSSYPSISASATLGVMPVTAVKEQLSLAVPPTATVGQSVTLTAKVKYANGTPVKGVAVTFYANGTQIGTSTTGEQGTASLTYAFSRSGSTDVTASSNGMSTSSSVSVQEISKQKATSSLAVYAAIVVLIVVVVGLAYFFAARRDKRS
ncbi:cellulase family glycosylhydrolase [Tardisphaera miroshnichenkoae]